MDETIPMEEVKMETTELSEKKLEQLAKQPIIETKIRKSKDGKFVIHETRIVDIKPILYYEKVMEDTDGTQV
jgi:hypothetical protein